MSSFCAPSSTRATSRSAAPSRPDWRAARCCRTARAWSSRPCVCTFNWNCWSFDDRPRADPADRRHDVLRLDRGDHVGRRQLQIVEPVGVEPDAHRVIQRAEQICAWPTPGVRDSTSSTLMIA